MTLLDNIDTQFLISIDIETVKLSEKYETLSENFKIAWEYKNKQEGVVPSNEELSNVWDNSAALYAEFSKVCAVSLTFFNKNGDGLICKEFYGDNEKEILLELAIFLEKISKKSYKYRLIGHAAKYFDYPYLCKRTVINGIRLPSIIDTAHLKPWESKNLCTNSDIWKMGGTGPGSSLIALCTVLEIPVSKVDMVGEDVGNAYYRKEYSRIGRYCSLDSIVVLNIVRKLKRESLFSFEEVKFI